MLRGQLAGSDKDKASLAQTKARLSTAEKQVRFGPSPGLGEDQRGSIFRQPVAGHVFGCGLGFMLHVA